MEILGASKMVDVDQLKRLRWNVTWLDIIMGMKIPSGWSSFLRVSGVSALRGVDFHHRIAEIN